MDHQWSELVARIVQAGRVSAGDVLELRDAVWGEDAISQAVADGIFLINDRCDTTEPSWMPFFVEAIEHFLLHQKPPFGFIDEEGAAWLRAKIDRDGRIGSANEMELLVSILEAAENAPEELKAFALSEIERTIVFGEGPTREGLNRPHGVDDAEVQLLRRLIFAGGGEGGMVVGSDEADLLFRIKDATLDGVNGPGWLQLFVQAVGNHLLTHSDYRPLSRDEAIRLNAEMDRNTPNIANFISRVIPREMIGSGTIVEAFKAVFPGNDGEIGGVEGDALTLEEARWLKTRIAADGETDLLEKALLTFVIDEAGNVPSALEALRLRA